MSGQQFFETLLVQPKHKIYPLTLPLFLFIVQSITTVNAIIKILFIINTLIQLISHGKYEKTQSFHLKYIISIQWIPRITMEFFPSLEKTLLISSIFSIYFETEIKTMLPAIASIREKIPAGYDLMASSI